MYTSGAVFDLVFVAKSRRTMGVLRVHGGTGEFVYSNWGVCVEYGVRGSFSQAEWRNSSV